MPSCGSDVWEWGSGWEGESSVVDAAARWRRARAVAAEGGGTSTHQGRRAAGRPFGGGAGVERGGRPRGRWQRRQHAHTAPSGGGAHIVLGVEIRPAVDQQRDDLGVAPVRRYVQRRAEEL